MPIKKLVVVAVALALAGSRSSAQGLGALWKDTPARPSPKKVDTTAKRPAAKPAVDTAAKRPAVKPIDSTAVLAATVRTQADTIAALRAKLVSSPKPVAPVATKAAVPPTIELLAARLDSLQSAQQAAVKQSAAVEKTTTQKLAGLGNFKFSGDLRVRFESQLQSGGFITRHRERSRARFAITTSLADDLTGAFGVASGTLDDVQSPNQTQTGFFARKAIGFDRFYLTWKPKAVTGLTVTGGKFPYLWERTSLTFGNDINPEGAAASYTRTTKGALQSATAAAFFLPFVEVSAGGDSYVSGGQIQTRWRVAPKLTARVSAASLAFRGADAIAIAAAAGTIKPASSNTNRLRTDSTGKILGFATEYAYTDLIAGVDFAVSPKLPVTAQVDAVRNRRAPSGENTGIWTDVKVGRLAQIKDVQATWSYMRIERDAVIGAFIEQDLRAATNTLGHKLAVSYQWRANATLGFGYWYGHLIDPTATPKLAAPDFTTACSGAQPSTCRDPWLSRLQFDLSYRF